MNESTSDEPANDETRTRVRSRTRTRPQVDTPTGPDNDEDGVRVVRRRRGREDPGDPGPGDARLSGGAAGGPQETAGETTTSGGSAAEQTAAAEGPGASSTGSDAGEGSPPRRRRGRRGGRGRGRGAARDSGDDRDRSPEGGDDAGAGRRREPERAERAGEAADATSGVDTAPDAEVEVEGDTTSGAEVEGDTTSDAGARDTGDDDAADAGDAASDTGPAAPTRLQTRSRRRADQRTARGRRGRPPRRPLGGVTEETRRAITEGPPRRMLVTVGEERTQIAVLEERDLVEHYVTRRKDTSYVGNIYLGRVQNVLPGMEAAFVDIGKGRNGVLYAGEVDYDAEDLDGGLPRIEQTLKPGQSVLVQVTKDPMGTKGARLTQQLSIAGRYCVLARGEGMLGISRKLTDEERERLRRVLKSIKPEGYGLIVRTAAEGATEDQLEADIARLVRIWEQVDERAGKVKPLEPVYEEPGLVIRVIRDVFGPEYTELIVDDAELGEQVRSYLGDVSPELADRITVHSGEDQLFDAYEVTNQIRRALEKKVWLASGGYLIIEKTEAMWVIDVNTGRFVGKSNLEETVLRNNIEAAEEIARQLRLRDMGGIIVIDFVDMLVPANRDEVLKRFKRELARDKTKSRVMEISKLGLVQMTRKNVSQGLNEIFTTTCDVCEGRGAQIAEHIV